MKYSEKYDGIKVKLEMQILCAIGLHVQRKYYSGEKRKRYRIRHEGFNNWKFLTLRRLAKLVFLLIFLFFKK